MVDLTWRRDGLQKRQEDRCRVTSDEDIRKQVFYHVQWGPFVWKCLKLGGVNEDISLDKLAWCAQIYE